jgi:Globin
MPHMQTKERIVDLGVKIFLALFKTVPDALRLFPFADADGKPVMSELRKHGLKTFVAFGDVIDGLDNADKTAQIFEHLVRCAPLSLFSFLHFVLVAQRFHRQSGVLCCTPLHAAASHPARWWAASRQQRCSSSNVAALAAGRTSSLA